MERFPDPQIFKTLEYLLKIAKKKKKKKKNYTDVN